MIPSIVHLLGILLALIIVVWALGSSNGIVRMIISILFFCISDSVRYVILIINMEDCSIVIVPFISLYRTTLK